MRWWNIPIMEHPALHDGIKTKKGAFSSLFIIYTVIIQTFSFPEF